MTANENALALLQPAVYIEFFAKNTIFVGWGLNVVFCSRQGEILFAFEPKLDWAEPRLESAG
jgi:hypothetical protein